MEEKYIATMMLHALGDTIGFKNGEWEMNNGTSLDNTVDFRLILELIFEFIHLGGVNSIDLTDWTVSDDTLFHMSIAKSLLSFSGTLTEEDMTKVKENMIDIYNRIVEEENSGVKLRIMGSTTEQSIKKWTKTTDARDLPFDWESGGNGCAMRGLCIGLAFYSKEKEDMLIDYAITTGMLTHNSPYGYLGGLVTALFTSYGIRGIDVEKWPFKMIKILDSEKVKKYIDKDNDDIFFTYRDFIKYWAVYVETRFKSKKPQRTKSQTNPLFRAKYYYDNFAKNEGAQLGSTGFCATIMAYDALLDCDGVWEKIIFYAILNPGDSDTVGAIAGGLYGSVYGFGDVPPKMLKHLEEKDLLKKYGEQIYSKYYR